MFHLITEVLEKLVPYAVRTNPGPPAVAELGDMEERAGATVGVVIEESVIANPILDVILPVVMVTTAVPAVAMSLAEICICNWDELT